MELPNYRLPGAKNVARLLWDKAKDFLQRAFTIIFVATIVIWFLKSFGTSFELVNDDSESILAVVAGFIAPLFKPLGFGDWRVSTALVTGFLAKESVVATMEVLFAGVPLTEVFPVATICALIAFCLLYTPCVAAVAAIKRELGAKSAAGMVVFQCAVAWVVAFVVKIIAGLF